MMTSLIGFAEPISSWSHLAAALGFLLAGTSLIRRFKGDGLALASILIFIFSVIFLLSMSGVYHLLEHGSQARSVLQRLDHAGIWTLIAGSFTPIHVILFRGFWRWGMLAIIWTLAITGLTLETIFFTEIPAQLVLGLYLGLGWVGVISGIKCMQMHAGRSIHFLVLGGVSYSLGAVIDFHAWVTIVPKFLAYHEIFHIFVIIGIWYHWRFIASLNKNLAVQS